MPSDDRKIWETYGRGVKRLSKTEKKTGSKTGVVPLPLRERLGEGALSKKPPHQQKLRLAEDGKPKFLRPLPQGERKNISFAKSLEKQMRAGTIEIDGRIDLHGMTQTEAYDALARFIARQVKIEHRHLLVITGKGKENKGVLRTNLPGWLESLPEAAQVLGMHRAAIPHGGDGAFYVILRRRRNADG